MIGIGCGIYTTPIKELLEADGTDPQTDADGNYQNELLRNRYFVAYDDGLEVGSTIDGSYTRETGTIITGVPGVRSIKVSYS